MKNMFFEFLHAKPYRIIWKLPQKISFGSEMCEIGPNSDSGEPEPNLNLHSRFDSAIHYADYRCVCFESPLLFCSFKYRQPRQLLRNLFRGSLENSRVVQPTGSLDATKF